ncbi:unnamed protein product [Discula destructiva]
MWVLLLRGNLSIAPIGEPTNVLDIGTGTGIWARGQDISLIQPLENLPPNCSFVREDTEDTWVFGKKFDYIHWRLMLTCFKDHKAMIAKVYENLAPGGWGEFQEWTVEIVGEDEAAEEFVRKSALKKWCELGVAGGAKFGHDFRAALKYKQWMVEAGFVDIQERQILVPVNIWPADPEESNLGGWFSLDAQKGVKGTAKLLEAAGMAPEDIPGFMDEVCDDVTHISMRAYSPHYVFYGRKPE